MFGYTIAIIVGLIILGFVIALLGGGKTRPTGRISSDKPVTRDEPSADEPTPGRSITADPQQTRAAQQHTPPA
jgi:hypothetical protein